MPRGGLVPEDYRFEQASDGREVRFSELFEAGKDTLVIYSFMFPRYSGDTRPGPAGGETARLALVETPCASCTSILDSLDGAASHLDRVINLVVVAKSDPERIRTFARERGWTPFAAAVLSRQHLQPRLQGRDTGGRADADSERLCPRRRPVAPTWSSELLYAPRHEGMEARHVDSIWPIWNVLDVTAHGRANASGIPSLRYD